MTRAVANPRKAWLCVRVTHDEKERLHAVAAREGIGLTDLVRAGLSVVLSFPGAKSPLPAPRDAGSSESR